jgi:hypothetical protein
MKLSEFKATLNDIDELNLMQHDGTPVPSHFHITEAGLLTKHFVDCGKTIHLKKSAVFQVWTAEDVWHRLKPETVVDIIDKSHKVFQGEDPEVEIEFQMETIGKFGLDFDGKNFLLVPKETDCLAKERCGIESASGLLSETAEACVPGGGCC